MGRSPIQTSYKMGAMTDRKDDGIRREKRRFRRPYWHAKAELFARGASVWTLGEFKEIKKEQSLPTNADSRIWVSRNRMIQSLDIV